MKNYNLFVSLVVAGALFVSGCGGGGGDSDNPPVVVVSEAFFIDSPVAGLFYKSQSKEGITAANGGFQYSPTDTNVTFKAGKITLGTIKVADINADSRLFIQDLVGVSRSIIDNADVLKIASLLQSLDTGANANGITLDENDLDNLNESADIADINVTRQLSLAGKALKSEEDVKEHLGDTIRRNGIALYNYTPQTEDSNITTLKNIVTNGTFSASDKNDNFLEFIVESNTTQGSVELIANSNSFKYTPNAEYVGSDSFTFKAYDGEKYSQVATVNIVVEDVVTTSNDTTAPTAPTIVSLDAQKDSLTLFWLSATDETTAAAEIRYEIHLSTDENFTADSTTLQQTLVNTLEADVSGLTPNTLYYIKVKALDSANNSTVSAQSSMQTLAKEVAFVQNAVVKQAASLHLEDAKETNSSLVFEDSEKAGVPNAGDILVGNAQDAYLKRVVSVDKNGTTTTLEVVDAAITDVVQSAKLSSKVVLFGTGNTDTSPSSAMRRSVSYKTNNTKEKELTWRSGRFGVIQSTQQAHSKARRSLSKSNTNFKATVVQDILTVVAGERLNIEVTAQMTQAGIDDDWTFTTMNLDSFKNNGKSVKGSSWTDSTNTNTASAIFSWTPSFNDISDTEYIATYEICAKDTTPSLFGNKRDCETLKSKIKVIAKPNDEPSGKTNVQTKVSTHSEFTNDIIIDFTPTLKIETEVVDGDVASAEVSVKGKLDFSVTSKFLYTAGITKEYDIKNIIPEKKYYKMYLLGGVPVYQEITFTLDAKLDAKAHGEINATSVLDTSFEMTAGMTYDGNSWTKIDSTPKVTKEYRASFGVAGGVEVNVRLIPNIEITFYKVATAGFSVEPWLKGTLSASGSATVYTDFKESDTMAIYGLQDLNITAGLEGKVYASLKVWKITLAKYPKEGKKTIFNPQLPIFNIPSIQLADNKNGICSGLPYQLNATIENPNSLISNDFVNSTIEWKVFPEIGASITPTSVDKLGATFEFSKKGEFTVYMIGNSEKLGKYGQQYATFNINTNDCPMVVPDKTPPVFTAGSAATEDVNENQTSAITLSATDDTSSVTYSISGEDSQSFSLNSTTGVVTFNVAPDYEATPTKNMYLFIATAEDSVGNKATQNVTINIIDVDETLPNELPVALSTSTEILQNSINNSITFNGIDTDKDPLTFIVVTQPQHGTLSGSGKNRLYTPDSEYRGDDSIEFKVNDGKADSTQNATVSLTIIEALNTPKVTSLSPTTATQNIATTFTIIGENLPSTIAMSLYDSLSCQSVNYISSTQATIVCTPNITGTKAFIVAKESGGDAIDSDVALEVSVGSAPAESICDMEKSNHSLASLLFNLPSSNSYDNPGYVTAQYLMEPYDHLIPGVLAHAGVDFRSKDGSNAGEDTVYSLTSGEVVRAENATGYGIVAIKMKNIANQDSVVFYAHLSSTTLNVGDTVNVGSIIGRTGKEGTSAPHLHLEYRVNYTGTSMIYKTSCGGDECTKAQIEDRTDDPIELLGFSCTEQKSLSELIVGKKVFQNYCGEINSLEFRTDGTIVNIDANATQSTQTYRIEGNTAYVTFDGEEKAITLVEHTSEYIRMSYGATMYFIEAKAQENPNSKNCSNNSSYDTGGSTLYNGKSYSILKAKSYMSDMQENPVQMFLKTSNSNTNEEGGFQLTINKFKDNNELKSFLQNNSFLLLAPGDFIEYGLQYMLTNNNPTGVTLSGSIKLTWLNDNDRFTIEQNGATLSINGKSLTFSKTIVQWTDENHSTNSGESKMLNWSGKLVFRDTNGNVQPLPSNLAVRITPNEEQINDNWGGIQVDVDSNGEWLVEEVQSSNYVDTTHYTTTNNYQFIVVDKDKSQEIYPFYDCNNNFLMRNRIEETQEYVSTAIISDFTKTIELSSTNECNNFSSASFSSIKKTGQTKSYDVNGTEVTDGSLKDDAYYKKGATPRYTRASDMVTDELTGLVWQDDEAAKTVKKQWLSDANYETCKNNTSSSICYDTSGDTAITYCSDLTLGGYTDWRLPSSTEIEGIVDYSKYNAAIDTIYFNNFSPSSYRSSTAYEGSKYLSWVVDFRYGYVSGQNKSSKGYVRCVRDGQ